MADNQSSLQENLIGRGLNPNNPAGTYVDFAEAIAKNQREQKAAEEALKLAQEHVKQARMTSKNQAEADEAGLNPLLVDTMTPEEARTFLKVIMDAKGLEISQEAIDEWVTSLPARVDRNTVEAFATRFARASTRSGQPAKFEKKDRIMIPEGSTAEELGLEPDAADPKFAHVPEDGMYQVVYDNQGVIKKFIPGGKDTAVKDGGLTPGQKAADIAFGRDYAEWVAAGGLSKVVSNLNKLKAVIENLRTRDDISGPAISLLPEEVRQRSFPMSQDVKDTIDLVIQQSLKLILGAQFTQNEAFAMMRRSFNIALEEAKNKKRVESSLKQLIQAAEMKAKAVKEFEATGSLKGLGGYEGVAKSLMDAVAEDNSKELIDGDAEPEKKSIKDFKEKPKTKVPKYTVEKPGK
jgi:hypothetical protein